MKRVKKNYHIFQLCYNDICSTYNIPMIFSIKTHLHKRMLDFNGDRVKLEEWKPILKALSLDRSLHYIAVRSKNSCSKVLDNIDSESKCRVMMKLPVLYSSFIFKKLMDSLSNCLINNFHLKCLELDGLLLTEEYLNILILGLRRSSSIQHLSLHRCPLGDTGCESICICLRSCPNIISLDLSGCNISEKGAYIIAKTLEFQNLNRYGENWKQSLRYQTPDTEIMPGLRRVTLNHNPNIGDIGVQYFIDVLRDDLWLKALDLQDVGLGNEGGDMVLALLLTNSCLSIIDVRNNHALDHSIIVKIMNQLAFNNAGMISEYHWIKEDPLFLPRKPSFENRNMIINNGKNQGAGHENSSKCAESIPAVRLTKSSVLLPLRPNLSVLQCQKTYSTSDVLLSRSNQPKTTNLLAGQFRTRRGCAAKITAPKYQHTLQDLFYGSGDVNTLEHARAKIEEMSLRLKEETQKRLEAERQRLNSERKFEQFVQDFKQAMFGQVIMDKSVLEEISNAFADFNGFLAVFAKSGLADQLRLDALKSSDDQTLSANDSTPMLSPFSSEASKEDSVKACSTLAGEKSFERIYSPIDTFCPIKVSNARDSTFTFYKQQDNNAASKWKNNCGSSKIPSESCAEDDCLLPMNRKSPLQIETDNEASNDLTLNDSANDSFDNTFCTEGSNQSWLTQLSSEDC